MITEELKNDSYIPYPAVMELLKEMDAKHSVYLYRLCRDGVIPAKKDGADWYLEKTFVEESIAWRNTVISTDELREQLAKEYCLENDPGFKRALRSAVKDFIVSSQYGAFFSGTYLEKDNLTMMENARACADWRAPKSQCISIEEATEKIGCSPYILKEIIKDGGLTAIYKQTGTLIEKKSLEMFLSKKENYIGIYDFLSSVVNGIRTTFDIGNRSNRSYLYAKLNKSSYSSFFITWEESCFHGDRRNSFYFPQHLRQDMYLEVKKEWEQFGTGEDRREKLMNDPIWKYRPNTYRIFQKFRKNKAVNRLTALADLLVNHMPKEIQECTNTDIAAFLSAAKSKGISTYEEIATKFVNYTKERYPVQYSVDLVRISVANGLVNNSCLPYTQEQYLAMAFMTINDEGIKRYDLVKRAIEDEKCALIWLRTIWTYCAAWRMSDFCSMPIISLPYDNKTTVLKILDGTYTEDAKRMALKLIAECNGRYTLPHKTMDYQNKQYRIVTIPASAYPVYGLVYSIARLHYAGKFPNTPFKPHDYIRIFGDDYRRIFGESAYSIRRANKSFLTILNEKIQAETPSNNRVLGYMVAALARSHSMRGDKLPDVTNVYLRNRMDGMTPNEILMLLWEAGTCSFIPLMLMQSIYGEKFSILDVKQQITLLKKYSTDALGTETQADCIRREYLRATQTIQYLFNGKSGDIEERTRNLIFDLATHHAPSKTVDIQCLKTAIGDACAFQGRESCFGCPYAIIENAFLYQAKKKIQNIVVKIKEASLETDRKRLMCSLNDIYLPPVITALEILKNTYHIDIDPFRQELIAILEDKGENT